MNRPSKLLAAAAASLALALALSPSAGCTDGGAPSGDATSGSSGTYRPSPTETSPARWVTRASCESCHPEETAAWIGSHHDLAMQEPTPDTVLGDFADATFTSHDGRETTFRREGERYVVDTEGPDGERGTFDVKYVFGVEPLQQVLLELPGGKLQGFTIAWDTDEEQWYDLYPNDAFPAGDALHWTGRYQNWNAMCAECHSTGLEKNYDPQTDTFATSYQEIDVSCEACHGPGGDHVDWATAQAEGRESKLDDRGLSVLLRRGEQQPQLDACAPCHSRRTMLYSNPLPATRFMDAYAPELLRPGSYFPDGQMEGEVYVYGSFTQSKMHAKGVSCTDCHDPHSLELLAPGNAACTQCHSIYAPLERFPTLTKKDYDSPEHHFHEAGTDGARCVNCHMPERTYMVVDERRDHSFRVPRPDLAAVLGTPDACSSCHEEGPSWAAKRIEEWYGPERASQGYHWSLAIAGGRAGDPNAMAPLIDLARDREAPSIARATAIELLRPYGDAGEAIGGEQLNDADPLVRQAAITSQAEARLDARLGKLLPLLDDEVRAVRMEAARQLAGIRPQIAASAMGAQVDDVVATLFAEREPRYHEALADWIRAQETTAELPWSHFNLATLYQDQKENNAAAASYRKALELDPAFLPARFNLATLYNTMGRNLEAERTLREGLELPLDDAERGELSYSLGLLLAEVGRLPDAATALVQASELLPHRLRIRYNAGLALQQAGRMKEAEEVFLSAEKVAPNDFDLLHALATFYESEGDLELALSYAERMERVAPEEAKFVPELVERIRSAARD